MKYWCVSSLAHPAVAFFCDFAWLDETIIPCNALCLMTARRGQSPRCSVRTAFANKHTDAVDMCFKLIGLPTHVRAIKLNYRGPETPLPLHPILSSVIYTRFFSQKRQFYSLGHSWLVPLESVLWCPRTTEAFLHTFLFFFSFLFLLLCLTEWLS